MNNETRKDIAEIYMLLGEIRTHIKNLERMLKITSPEYEDYMNEVCLNSQYVNNDAETAIQDTFEADQYNLSPNDKNVPECALNANTEVSKYNPTYTPSYTPIRSLANPLDYCFEDTSVSKRNFPTDWSMKNFQNWDNNY